MFKIYLIDAGVEHIHVWIKKGEDIEKELVIMNNDEARDILGKTGIWQELASDPKPDLLITGKLADTLIKALGYGKKISTSAAFWSAAKKLHKSLSHTAGSLGIIDLSSSGYLAISIDDKRELLDDNLVVNPRCGAGSGTNLSRILQKLDIGRSQVDQILKDYLGEEGRENRSKIPVRADRCGVFSSSATVSDKNQGIPLPVALATTLKSEVLKACKKLSSNVEVVYLTGRVFCWQFARDCAEDYLSSCGTGKIIFDQEQSIALQGLDYLAGSIGFERIKDLSKIKLLPEETMLEYPAFRELASALSEKQLYVRLPDQEFQKHKLDLRGIPLDFGLDIGSTMAKLSICNSKTKEVLFLSSYDNHGDTIETVKHIFTELVTAGFSKLNVQHIGITGSGRYQVKKVLEETYPHLMGRISALVENYAHARGSIDYAKAHLDKLSKAGRKVNKDFCLLVDVGGEDTKISVVSLDKEDLHDNAMNIKCSAGTGSLMDTLRSMFGIENIREAASKAMEAGQAFGINATCAVFLMENARKMQLEGFPQEEILASCYWAIVENMARTLWPQIEFPAEPIVLLHGQTMLSDPLPLAITKRIQEYIGTDCYCLIPPNPGHRACLGLVKSLPIDEVIDDDMDLSLLVEREFERKVFVCHGAACSDVSASCTRSILLYQDESGSKRSLTLGGCTTVNEMEAKRNSAKAPENRMDSYALIWKFIDSQMPKNSDADRLVIPRSFAISDTAFFWAKIFSYFNIPVHVDNVISQDILDAQPRFHIDTCAPLIGATGQFIRLAKEEHGIILVPQLDFLATDNASLGRTCTTNQGGVVIATRFAQQECPKANFKLFDASLKDFDPRRLASELLDELRDVFGHYGIGLSIAELEKSIIFAKHEFEDLKNKTADNAADCLEKAIADHRRVILACGREYILNPGVYDSHVGRLFGDKGTVVLPSYILDVALEDEFRHMYWKNPHFILSIARSVRDKKLHEAIKHERLSALFKKFEQENGPGIGIVLVSTFRCGPDTMMLPVVQEMFKDAPILTIQSDAAINELAHLENRVNTYLNQLSAEAGQHSDRLKNEFNFEILTRFTSDSIDKDKDVFYFPTLSDNRMIAAVLRSAGYTCVYNYDDDSYDLPKIIKFGRKFCGDTVCAPFAAVLADSILAVKDFLEKKKNGIFKDKRKVIIFNNKGTGPCRQGQYYEMHRLFLYRELDNFISAQGDMLAEDIDGLSVQYIVGAEKDSFNIGLDLWALVQAFHSFMSQAVFHSMYLLAGANCRDMGEFELFRKDYYDFKTEWVRKLENSWPHPVWFKAQKIFGSLPGFRYIFLYFGTGLYNNNGVREMVKEFSDKWVRKIRTDDKLKVHIEGEVYMRVAQHDLVFGALVENVGFGKLAISYSPIWCYFEYLLEMRQIENRKVISRLVKDAKEYEQMVKKLKKQIRLCQALIWIYRKVCAQPLYKAAGIPMPEPFKSVLAQGREVLATAKPYGELVPYVGEAIHKLRHGYDLYLNIAPEGCMVASMGEMFTSSIYQVTEGQRKDKARIQGLFSMDGEVDQDKLNIALLKILGPEGMYKN